MSRSIVLLFGSGFDSGQVSGLSSETSRLEVLVASDPEATIGIISLGLTRPIDGVATRIDLRPDGLPLADRVLQAIGAYALRSRLATFPLGRLLNSLGPVDQGRVFWRSVRRNRAAVSLLKNADTVIAADVPGTKTAWIALHRWKVAEAFYDHRSASVGETFTLPKR